MTLRPALAALTCLALATPALAEGDPEKGEKEFAKCRSCHMIESESETIVKGGKTGPNLYGVIGRTAGALDGFTYGDDIVAAGESGRVRAPRGPRPRDRRAGGGRERSPYSPFAR